MKPRAGVSTIIDWRRTNAEPFNCRHCEALVVPVTPQQKDTCAKEACKRKQAAAWQRQRRAKIKRAKGARNG